MKKYAFILLFIFAGTAVLSAQEISENAIGIRVGDNDGFGTEINYQRALGR